jgi:hypothetical protein
MVHGDADVNPHRLSPNPVVIQKLVGLSTSVRDTPQRGTKCSFIAIEEVLHRLLQNTLATHAC